MSPGEAPGNSDETAVDVHAETTGDLWADHDEISADSASEVKDDVPTPQDMSNATRKKGAVGQIVFYTEISATCCNCGSTPG